MHMMNDVLSGYLDVFVLVFLDDILVYSKTVEEHAEHLRKVFDALKKHRLFAKASKCTFLVREVEFLGQVDYATWSRSDRRESTSST